jgi:hypothetical protein
MFNSNKHRKANTKQLIGKKKINCLLNLYLFNVFRLVNQTCETVWDTVYCWPETLVNMTVQISCPNYVDKFNMKRNFVFVFKNSKQLHNCLGLLDLREIIKNLII